MFQSKKVWKFVGVFIAICFVCYIFFYFPIVPIASIKIEHNEYELKAKDYDYSIFGISRTKNLSYESVNELNDYLQKDPELTVRSNQPISYKNNASTTYTQVFYYSVDQNEAIPRVETKTTVQSIEKPGHYILQYSTEFETGKIANYFVRIHVIK